VREGLFKELAGLVRHLANIEVTSTSGRINILGMVLSLILAISLSLAPIFETLIRLVHPNVSIGAPILELFIAFCLFTIICASMIGYLEGPRSDRARWASSERPQKPPDSDPSEREPRGASE
jgi:hypothetical protein